MGATERAWYLLGEFVTFWNVYKCSALLTTRENMATNKPDQAAILTTQEMYTPGCTLQTVS